MLDTLLPALAGLLHPEHFMFLFLGVVIGLIVGILPGLSGVAGFSLVLPFIYGMDPVSSLAMLIGLTAVTATSDTFTSVLLGIPGSSAAQATVLDGFPLAKKGEAARALAAAFSASLAGGLFGAVVLTVAIFFARPLILAIGFGEQLLLLLFGLSMVGLLAGASPIKGLAACGLGLLLGSIGSAPATGEWRLAFDIPYLADGVPLIVLALGLYAIPEIIDLLRRDQAIAGANPLGRGWLKGLRDTLDNWWLVLRCSAVGGLVGALPGLGGAVVDWIAYGHAVQTSRDKTLYGKGDIRGVIAPESANNAKEGGALIPTLLFGIPGSGATAVLLGGMILIGIQPGIDMVTDNLDLTYTMIWSLALANVIGAGICFLVAPQIARLTTIRYTLIGPIMIVMIMFAAFQASRQWGDLVALMGCGVLGIYMRRFAWSRPALLIGFVLSDRLEVSLYQAVQVYGLSIFERPLVWVIGLLTLLSVVFAVRSMRSARAENGLAVFAAEPGFGIDSGRAGHRLREAWPQLLFAGAIAGFAAFALTDALSMSFLSKLFPITIAAVTLAMVAVTAVTMLFGPGTTPTLRDEERADAEGEQKLNRSVGHYLLWLVGLLAGIYLAGFLIAIAAFLLAFLTLKASPNHVRNVVITACVIGVLTVISQMLVVSYPDGLLQNYLDMPWPFN